MQTTDLKEQLKFNPNLKIFVEYVISTNVLYAKELPFNVWGFGSWTFVLSDLLAGDVYGGGFCHQPPSLPPSLPPSPLTAIKAIGVSLYCTESTDWEDSRFGLL